jgi:thiol-disulfide isomerase/thioredoxin
MFPTRLTLLVLLTIPALWAQTDDLRSSDGLPILQQMSQHYASAGSWHIESTEERTSENEYSRNWTKTVTIGAVSGNKYRFEGHSGVGSAVHISDARTAWDLHPEEHAYTQASAPANVYQPPHMWPTNEQAALDAVNLRKRFAEFSGHYDSAARLPDEVIFQDGTEIPCYVVQVKAAQRKGPKEEGISIDETLWIEKSAWTVRQTVVHQSTFLYSGAARIPLLEDAVTSYRTAELNSAIPEALFHFEPPADARLVAKFSDDVNDVDLTGEAAPEIQLTAANGRLAPLSSYKGKPVLLDFWATWCGPCIASMPDIATLYQEAMPKGLVMLSIDEDEDVKTATDFLVKHGYTWPNTQDDGKIGDAFKKMGIPLFVLLDAQGKIVFYKAGDDDAGLRKAIAALGPQFASLALEQKPQTCRTASK